MYAYASPVRRTGKKKLNAPSDLTARMSAMTGYNMASVQLTEDAHMQNGRNQAEAQGNQIRFAPGVYRKDSGESRRILAHEMAHIAQQARGEAHGSGEVDNATLENAADTAYGQAMSTPGETLSDAAAAPLPVMTAAPTQGNKFKFWGSRPAQPEMTEEQKKAQDYKEASKKQAKLNGTVFNPRGEKDYDPSYVPRKTDVAKSYSYVDQLLSINKQQEKKKGFMGSLGSTILNKVAETGIGKKMLENKARNSVYRDMRNNRIQLARENDQDVESEETALPQMFKDIATYVDHTGSGDQFMSGKIKQIHNNTDLSEDEKDEAVKAAKKKFGLIEKSSMVIKGMAGGNLSGAYGSKMNKVATDRTLNQLTERSTGGGKKAPGAYQQMKINMLKDIQQDLGLASETDMDNIVNFDTKGASKMNDDIRKQTEVMKNLIFLSSKTGKKFGNKTITKDDVSENIQQYYQDLYDQA